MPDPAGNEKIPWHSISTFFTRKLTILQIIANLAGAGIVTSYFMFFDPSIKVQDITNDLIVIGIMFVGLVLIATLFLQSESGFEPASESPAKNPESAICKFSGQPV